MSNTGWIKHNFGYLQLDGSSRIDLLHRMTTQNVKNLSAGQGRATLLLTNIGRFIDRLILCADTENAHLITSEGQSDKLARYLSRYIFFQDDLRITDQTAEYQFFGVYGADAGKQLTELGFHTELALNHWNKATINDLSLALYGAEPINGGGYWICAKASDSDAVETILNDAGISPIDDDTYNAYRVEAESPRFGAEISDAYIPLETGLWQDISFTKGCYLGQEIIARMESRKKLSKQLVKLTIDSAVVGAEISANGKVVGSVTSVSPTAALGYLKSSALEKELFIGDVAVSAVKTLANRD